MQHLSTLPALALSTALLLSGTAVAQQPEALNIVSWGGAYTQSQIKAYHDPWTEKTGIKIVNIDEGGTAPAKLRAQVESGTVTWDLVDVLEAPAIRLCDEGLAEEIDYDKVLAAAPDGTLPTEDFIEGTLSGCFIPEIVYATLFAYNDDMFPDAKPQTIADVFDLEKFPGKRSLEKTPYANLEWALYADGVAIEDIYEVLDTDEGLDRAFAKLDTIKSQVVWWEAGAQPPQLLADKEVAIASGYNGRFFNAQVIENQPFTILWDGQVFELDGWVIPKGTPNLETVLEYLHFATDTQRLADQAKFISYGPARNSSAPLVATHAETGVDMKPHMPTNPENFTTAIKKDALFWVDNYDSINQRFSAWLAQ